MKKKQIIVKDILISVVLCLIIGILAASALGFLSEGIDSPISYSLGDDDFSIINQIKQLTQERWLWSTNRLGAPYSQQVYDYSSFFLQNTEYLMIKFWSLFTNNVPIIENMLYLSTFIFCGLSAYFVMRKMHFEVLFAFCGALLYAFNPFIFGRAIGHYCLTACYFVPIAVYFCHVTYFDENYLKLDRSFFSLKTVFVFIACWCIANNGIGYYPFFTCFLLCVSALCKLLETHRIKTILPQIKVIICIVIFMVIALLPTFIYHMNVGSNNIAAREPWEVEYYSLKITQMFVPMSTHGIGWITDLVNEYNMNMPLVNENMTAYLGFVGCIGFLIGLLLIFSSKDEKIKSSEIFLIARMNLASVLFMTVGGFISLLAIVSKIYIMRSFNRISVYIMFCSLLIIFFLFQNIYQRINKSGINQLFVCGVFVLTLFGLWDQTPTLYSDGSSLRFNMNSWNNDEAFINKIENELNIGDMVFQLPYHKYPEAGPVNDMLDYQLLIGYIHSDSLRWSFGGMKGRESDKWNEYVSRLNMNDMIETIISSGFRGIYIDKRAYTDEEYRDLSSAIESIIKVNAYESNDGNLVFYNLYPYIEVHKELLQKPALTVGDIEYPMYEYGDVIDFTRINFNASSFVDQGISSPEESFTWTQGERMILNMTVGNSVKGDLFDANVELADVFDVQHVTILVNGYVVSVQELHAGDSLSFGGEVGENGIVEIEIDIPDCKSPKDLGMSGDDRKLGLAIKTITLTRGK